METLATRNMTFGDLIAAAAEHSDTDAELAATVAYLVNSGKVRFCGNLKGARFDVGELQVSRPQAA